MYNAYMGDGMPELRRRTHSNEVRDQQAECEEEDRMLII